MQRSTLLLIVLASCALFLAPSPVRCQDPPVEWEEIPKADLEMKVYAPDTSAAAVILADYGESQINSQLGVTFKRHTRIKIFSAAGYDWGTHSVNLYTKDRSERWREVEGATYSLRPDGSVQKTELDDNEVFTEKIDEDNTRYRFTMPALQPGCIVEFRYEVAYKNALLMPTWDFQTTIPTVWSEYRTLIPMSMAYAKVAFTFEPFYIKDETVRNVSIGGDNMITGGSVTKCDYTRWAMRNMPALRDEPFTTCMDDYTPQVRLQLAKYALPEAGIQQVLKSWDVLISEMLDDDDFGGRLEPSKKITSLTEQVTLGKSTPLEKMIAVYDHVRSTYVWNDKTSMWAKDFDDLFASKKGDSGDINLLLVAMLKAAGLDADPVIASTRSHGLVTDVYPLLTQFNTVAARVTMGSFTYYLDATDPLRPYSLIAPDLLNVAGFVVKKGPVSWVTIMTNKRFFHRSFAQVELDASGEIRGSLSSIDDEYSALRSRRSLREKKPIEIARDLFDADKLGITLDSVTITGRDSTAGQLRVQTTASGSSYAQVAGDHIYFNPVLLDRLSSNPLKAKERKFPIDMSYARDILCVTTVHAPAGFEPKEVPRNVSFGGNDIAYQRTTIAGGDSVRTTTRLTVSNPYFPASEYQRLRGLYDQIVAAESEQVVLERKPPPPVEPAPATHAKQAKRPKKK